MRERAVDLDGGFQVAQFGRQPQYVLEKTTRTIFIILKKQLEMRVIIRHTFGGAIGSLPPLIRYTGAVTRPKSYSTGVHEPYRFKFSAHP